jgi:CheY-like chemotaxis protein
MNVQLNVLIVDPDTDARECLRDLLEVEGYHVMSAPPGAEAAHLIRQSEEPCIVLINMIGVAETGLQHLALVEHEKSLLDVALKVLNESRGLDDKIATESGDASPAVETLQERHLFQLAMTAPLPKVRPLAKLVKTSAVTGQQPLARVS